MNTKENNILFIQLRALKIGRTQLINDFLDCKYEIYEPSYKYEQTPIVLKLAREKYFMSWLSNHWIYFDDVTVLCSDNNIDSLKISFAKTFLELITKFSIIKSRNHHQLTLTLKLLEDLKISLNYLIESSDTAQLNLNKIKLTNTKNNVLFDRMLEEINIKENK